MLATHAVQLSAMLPVVGSSPSTTSATSFVAPRQNCPTSDAIFAASSLNFFSAGETCSTFASVGAAFWSPLTSEI